MNFTISELVITGSQIPLEVADKLLRHHIIPMQKVRDVIKLPIHCTTSKGLNSGYRPVWWELQNGRKGNSQHTFKGKGAIDWRCKGFSENKSLFLNEIIKWTDYTRIAIYHEFIHCDYLDTHDHRYLYKSDNDSNWELIDTLSL